MSAALGARVRQATVRDVRTAVVLLDDGAETMPVANSQRRFRPTKLVITWDRRDGGAWELYDVVAHGPVVKKDGTDSSLTAKRALIRWAERRRGWTDDAPAWAKDSVTRYAPSGDGPR